LARKVVILNTKKKKKGVDFMRSIVIYYSQTGNTKTIAEAIYRGIQQVDNDSRIAPLKEVDVR